MKIKTPFRTALFATLGVGLGILLLGMVASLATIITYIGVALFLALGLEPLIAWLVKKKLPRWAAILTVVIGVIGVFVGLVFAIVPVIIEQATSLVTTTTEALSGIAFEDALAWVDVRFGEYFDVNEAWQAAQKWLQDPTNIGELFGGAFNVVSGVTAGLFGSIIVLILTLYFTASLDGLKRAMYQLVPASSRARFAGISEQVTDAVGRFVIGQIALALVNGILTFIFLSIIGAKLPAVFAFVAFTLSLIPLVGTISGAVIITVSQLLLASPGTAIAAAVYYLVYMQVEAYVLSPNIMSRAVSIPGVLVVIAALAGGTLLGVLGALIAIPVAASILLIVKQVVIPRQNEL